MENETLQEQLQDAIGEAMTDVLSVLSAQQKAALEAKYYTLPEEVRSSTDSKFPTLTVCGRYVARQIIKEANGKLASIKRPEWYSKLVLNAASLKSNEEAISKYAESQLRDLAESIDSKESMTLLKKYKNANDLTSKDAHIVKLAGIFGVSSNNLS